MFVVPFYQALSNEAQVLFETGVIWYAEKRKHWRPLWNADLQEDLSNAPTEEIVSRYLLFGGATPDGVQTFSMKLSTDHIIKDVEREKEEARAQRAAMQIESSGDPKEDPFVSSVLFSD